MPRPGVCVSGVCGTAVCLASVEAAPRRVAVAGSAAAGWWVLGLLVWCDLRCEAVKGEPDGNGRWCAVWAMLFRPRTGPGPIWAPGGPTCR